MNVLVKFINPLIMKKMLVLLEEFTILIDKQIIDHHKQVLRHVF